MSRVLVVDDDPETADLIRRHLAIAGHEVVEVYHRAIGIASRVAEHAAAGPLDVLLDVDWRGLPEHGVKVAALCKRVAPRARVYLCSSRSAEELRALARESGADGWFDKSAIDQIGARLGAERAV